MLTTEAVSQRQEALPESPIPPPKQSYNEEETALWGVDGWDPGKARLARGCRCLEVGLGMAGQDRWLPSGELDPGRGCSGPEPRQAQAWVG